MKTKIIPTLALTALFALATVACDKKDDAKKDDVKADDVKADDVKADDVKADDVKADDAVPEQPPAPTGPQPSNDKEFLGLDLQPVDGWTPEWDADAKVAKWVNEEIFYGIVIRVVSDKLTSMDELKAAAPMMMQVGTAISSVTKDVQKTEQGWWTVVKYDDDKGEVYLNIAEINGTTVVCSANLGSGMGDPITEELAHKACSSYKLKE
jgi:hypothetical protein